MRQRTASALALALLAAGLALSPVVSRAEGEGSLSADSLGSFEAAPDAPAAPEVAETPALSPESAATLVPGLAEFATDPAPATSADSAPAGDPVITPETVVTPEAAVELVPALAEFAGPTSTAPTIPGEVRADRVVIDAPQSTTVIFHSLSDAAFGLAVAASADPVEMPFSAFPADRYVALATAEPTACNGFSLDECRHAPGYVGEYVFDVPVAGSMPPAVPPEPPVEATATGTAPLALDQAPVPPAAAVVLVPALAEFTTPAATDAAPASAPETAPQLAAPAAAPWPDPEPAPAPEAPAAPEPAAPAPEVAPAPEAPAADAAPAP